MSIKLVKKGTIIVVTKGEYDDYRILGLIVTTENTPYDVLYDALDKAFKTYFTHEYTFEQIINEVKRLDPNLTFNSIDYDEINLYASFDCEGRKIEGD